MSEKSTYTIVPIAGMEFVQKNFVKYGDGIKSADDFLADKKPSLAKRFQLIERGYTLKLNASEDVELPTERKCFLECKALSYNKENSQANKNQETIPKPLSKKKPASSSNFKKPALKDNPPKDKNLQNSKNRKSLSSLPN